MIPLTRLRADSDVGLIGAGLVGKVVPEIDAEGKPTGTNIVQLWVTVACGQPQAIGGLDVIEIPWAPLATLKANDLIEKYLELQAQRRAGAPSLIVP